MPNIIMKKSEEDNKALNQIGIMVEPQTEK
jgi:hypothetical protein